MNSRQIDFIKKDCANVFQSVEHLNALKGEHLFVTGGTGFFGKWIAEAISFLNESYGFETKLTLLSRNSDQFKKITPHLATKDYISVIDNNVCDLFEIPNDVSWVIHAAATPDNREHSSNPINVVETITAGTNKVLDACLRLSNLKRLLNISSGLIYGRQNGEGSSIGETFEGCPNTMEAGTSSYAEAKRMGESFCSIYRNLYRLPIVTVRPFAFIGPYQLIDRPWAINNFINDALKGGPIKILGDQSTVRSYMYPSDMVYWILSLLVKGSTGQAYNLGNPSGVTLNGTANIVANCFTKKPVISIPPTHVRNRRTVFVPDTGKAESELDLKITVDNQQAIEKTIQWLQLSN